MCCYKHSVLGTCNPPKVPAIHLGTEARSGTGSTNLCTYVCHVCMCVCMYVCVYVCMCVCMYYVCMCMYYVCMFVCLYLVIYCHYQSLRTFKVSANNCSGTPCDFIVQGVQLLVHLLPDLVTGIQNTAFCWKNEIQRQTCWKNEIQRETTDNAF